MADNVEVFRIILDYQTSYEGLERVKEKLKAAQSETRNLTIKQQELNEQFKQGVISEQEYQSASEALRQKLIANRKEVTALTEERRKAMQIEKSMALAEMAEANSLIQLRETLKTLTKQFDALGEAKQKSAKGVQLQKEIDGLNKKILELEMSTGRFGRNVGNYASGFNPLNFQVQQLTRELPSLTMNLQQFFLAISNNLPMFADELQRAAAANEKLRKEGHATIPVWRQVLSALGSWQTMLVVGITLLTAYGKEIGQWVKELFKGKKAIDEVAIAMEIANEKGEAYKDAFKSASSTYGQNLVLLNQLRDKWNQLGDDLNAKKRFIDENKTSFSNLGVSVTSVKDAENLFVGNTATFVEAMKIRAQAIASQSTLAELYAKQLQASTEAERLGIMAEWRKNNITQNDRDEARRIESKLNAESGTRSRSIVVDPAEIAAKQAAKFTEYQKEQIAKAEQYNTQINLVYKQMAASYTKLQNTMKAGGFKPNAGSGSLGKTENVYKKIALDELKAAQELALSEQNYAAKMNEAILNDENQSYENRMAALEQFTSKKQNVILQGADDEIENLIRSKAKELNLDADNKNDRVKLEKLLSNQIGVIRDEANTKVLELEETKNKKQQVFAEKKIQQDLDTQKFQVSLMEDGTAKQLALLEIEHAEKLMKAKKNGTDLLEIDKWYKKEQEKILAASPHGERIKADAQAAANYHKEIARIESLKIKEKEKDYLKAKAENDLEKTKILNHKAEIDRLYSLGKITVDEYNKMSAEIGVDLANNENKGNELEDPKNPKLKKVGSFFARLFGYDPDDKDDRKEFKQKRKELIDQAADTAREIGQAVIDIQTEISQRRLKLEQERIDAERDSELKSLELRYNKGLMSEKAYNKAVEATNAEADRKKEEAERAAFEREKRLKIMGIAIDTAAGITKVWSETGLTGWKLAMAIAQTAFLTANGIAQTAVISNQQFAQGGIVPIGDGKNGVSMGMLQGPSHSQGGIPLMVNGQPVNAEVEGGEILAVINKRSAAQYLPLFSAINATNGVKFENGGVIGSGWTLPTPAPLPPSNGQMLASMRDDLRTYYRQTERMIKATTERIDNIKVHVVEKDITKTQKKVASIRAKATIIGGK